MWPALRPQRPRETWRPSEPVAHCSLASTPVRCWVFGAAHRPGAPDTSTDVWVCAMASNLSSITPTNASKSSRWFCSAIRTGRMRLLLQVLACQQLGGDKIEQFNAGGPTGTRERQHVTAQPLSEGLDVFGQSRYLHFGVSCHAQLKGACRADAELFGDIHLQIHCLSPGSGPLGHAVQYMSGRLVDDWGAKRYINNQSVSNHAPIPV